MIRIITSLTYERLIVEEYVLLLLLFLRIEKYFFFLLLLPGNYNYQYRYLLTEGEITLQINCAQTISTQPPGSRSSCLIVVVLFMFVVLMTVIREWLLLQRNVFTVKPTADSSPEKSTKIEVKIKLGQKSKEKKSFYQQ